MQRGRALPVTARRSRTFIFTIGKNAMNLLESTKQKAPPTRWCLFVWYGIYEKEIQQVKTAILIQKDCGFFYLWYNSKKAVIV